MVCHQSDLWCKEFRNLGGKYILYHNYAEYKDRLIKDFVTSGYITTSLKTAISESWGSPVWGNHVEKTDADLRKDEIIRTLEQRLLADPRFTIVETYYDTKEGEYDKSVLFKLNSDYCASLSLNQN